MRKTILKTFLFTLILGLVDSSISKVAKGNHALQDSESSSTSELWIAEGPEPIPPAASLVAEGPEPIPPAGVLVAEGPEPIPPALLVAEGPEPIPPAGVLVAEGPEPIPPVSLRAA
jgi:hypothetical protein